MIYFNVREGDILDTVNERIKELRLKLGMNQEEFGESIGLSKSGISNIESGLRGVRERHIKLIANVFNVSEEWLRTGRDPIEELSIESHRIGAFMDYLKSCGYKVTIEVSDEVDHERLEETDEDNTSPTITVLKLMNDLEKAVQFELFRLNHK